MQGGACLGRGREGEKGELRTYLYPRSRQLENGVTRRPSDDDTITERTNTTCTCERVVHVVTTPAADHCSDFAVKATEPLSYTQIGCVRCCIEPKEEYWGREVGR